MKQVPVHLFYLKPTTVYATYTRKQNLLKQSSLDKSYMST